jgi:ribosomal-protein-alanine N-acetyltransferase
MSLPTPTLRTARLRLRPFTSADADALFALHSSAYCPGPEMREQ